MVTIIEFSASWTPVSSIFSATPDTSQACVLSTIHILYFGISIWSPLVKPKKHVRWVAMVHNFSPYQVCDKHTDREDNFMEYTHVKQNGGNLVRNHDQRNNVRSCPCQSNHFHDSGADSNYVQCLHFPPRQIPSWEQPLDFGTLSWLKRWHK